LFGRNSTDSIRSAAPYSRARLRRAPVTLGWHLLCASIAGVSFAGTAFACARPTPWHDPARTPSTVIIEGIAGQISGRDTPFRSAKVRIAKRLKGNYAPATVQIRWTIAPGMCGPAGPIPEAGMPLKVYMTMRNGELVVQGWLPIQQPPIPNHERR
jgi:hypothetical protein